MRTLRSVGRDEAGRHVVLDDLALALESHRPHLAHRIAGILAMAAAGGSGMFLWKSRKVRLVDAKKKRMPFIAANGLLVLVPCAFVLNRWAGVGSFDTSFHVAQAIELIAGAAN